MLLQCPPFASIPPLHHFATHLWHGSLALEASSHSVVDTLWLSPAGVHAHEPVTLVTAEARGVLLDDWHMLLCGDHLCCVDGGLVGVVGEGRIEDWRFKVRNPKWPSQALEFWASAMGNSPCVDFHFSTSHHCQTVQRDAFT